MCVKNSVLGVFFALVGLHLSACHDRDRHSSLPSEDVRTYIELRSYQQEEIRWTLNRSQKVFSAENANPTQPYFAVRGKITTLNGNSTQLTVEDLSGDPSQLSGYAINDQINLYEFSGVGAFIMRNGGNQTRFAVQPAQNCRVPFPRNNHSIRTSHEGNLVQFPDLYRNTFFKEPKGFERDRFDFPDQYSHIWMLQAFESIFDATINPVPNNGLYSVAGANFSEERDGKYDPWVCFPATRSFILPGLARVQMMYQSRIFTAFGNAGGAFLSFPVDVFVQTPDVMNLKFSGLLLGEGDWLDSGVLVTPVSYSLSNGFDLESVSGFDSWNRLESFTSVNGLVRASLLDFNQGSFAVIGAGSRVDDVRQVNGVQQLYKRWMLFLSVDTPQGLQNAILISDEE